MNTKTNVIDARGLWQAITACKAAARRPAYAVAHVDGSGDDSQVSLFLIEALPDKAVSAAYLGKVDFENERFVANDDVPAGSVAADVTRRLKQRPGTVTRDSWRLHERPVVIDVHRHLIGAHVRAAATAA